MVETKSPGDKTLSVPTKTLTLKPRVETGTVRQSFSHGRTKQVVVEKRGKRRVAGEPAATETRAPEPAAAKVAPAKAPTARPATPPFGRGAANAHRGRALRPRQRARGCQSPRRRRAPPCRRGSQTAQQQGR